MSMNPEEKIQAAMDGYRRSGRWRPCILIDEKPRHSFDMGIGFMWPPGARCVMVRIANYVITAGFSDWAKTG